MFNTVFLFSLSEKHILEVKSKMPCFIILDYKQHIWVLSNGNKELWTTYILWREMRNNLQIV